jgi:hypothetical protein
LAASRAMLAWYAGVTLSRIRNTEYLDLSKYSVKSRYSGYISFTMHTSKDATAAQTTARRLAYRNPSQYLDYACVLAKFVPRRPLACHLHGGMRIVALAGRHHAQREVTPAMHTNAEARPQKLRRQARPSPRTGCKGSALGRLHNQHHRSGEAASCPSHVRKAVSQYNEETNGFNITHSDVLDAPDPWRERMPAALERRSASRRRHLGLQVPVCIAHFAWLARSRSPCTLPH